MNKSVKEECLQTRKYRTFHWNLKNNPNFSKEKLQPFVLELPIGAFDIQNGEVEFRQAISCFEIRTIQCGDAITINIYWNITDFVEVSLSKKS